MTRYRGSARPFFTTLIFFLFANISFAASADNQTSPLGINLEGVNYWSAEQPFLDVFKTADVWLTQGPSWDTGEESKLDLDTHGWAKSLSGAGGQPVTYTQVGLLVFRGLPLTSNGYYPSGKYVVLYDGEGTIDYELDGRKDTNASGPGRDVVDVTPSSAGVWVQIKATDPKHTGNYIRNIRMVKAEQEDLLKGGEVFNPAFIDKIKRFRVLRFMDWMATNNSTQSVWSGRPEQSKATYGGSKGVPLEVMLSLSNKIHADPWFNMPHMATDDYVTQFAALVHRQLGSDQKVYVEYSNEVWNGMFAQRDWAVKQGKTIWTMSTAPDYEKGFNWYGMRTSRICEIWKSVWGADANRVICVAATQAANPGVSSLILGCSLWSQAPCATNHGISALGVAPYFGEGVPLSWTSQSDGGLSSLFAEAMKGGVDPAGYQGGSLRQAIDWVVAQKKIADRYNLDLYAYEGGPGYVNSGDAALTDLYMSANKDPRMGTAVETYLQQWKNTGGKLFNYFSDIGSYSKWGSWGALESIMQTNSPKYDAIMNFITTTPCWWSNCTTNSKTSGGNLETSTPTPQKLAGPFFVGMRGSEVRKLQAMLAKDSTIYAGNITGYYGPQTIAAVQKFQAKYHILTSGSPATTGYGLAGPMTRAKLNQLCR